MAGRLTVIILALVIILTSPAPATAPVIVPEVVQEYQEPEPEPETVTFEATAYTWTGSRTATGTWPSRGTVAVDPRVIPLGSELYVEGYGPAVAADTGGDIKGQRIDLYMESYEEAIQFGRREVLVEVLRE
jgi:3D (Asp-Asp-Asp) domain-containing protein